MYPVCTLVLPNQRLKLAAAWYGIGVYCLRPPQAAA
jgi:hypothetical protein